MTLLVFDYEDEHHFTEHEYSVSNLKQFSARHQNSGRVAFFGVQLVGAPSDYGFWYLA